MHVAAGLSSILLLPQGYLIQINRDVRHAAASPSEGSIIKSLHSVHTIHVVIEIMPYIYMLLYTYAITKPATLR